ncbi:MAG TPA: hypothetical protein VMS86_02565 [Thermoanaerobaculia bacterium]|nr:hypothetical protein [Thermoanaerobaculia bacterium]
MPPTARYRHPLSARPRAEAAQSPLAAERDSRLRLLIALAVLLLVLALGPKVTGVFGGTGSGPTRLSRYEAHQLEEVRYVLWLDQARRNGELDR